MTVNAQTIRNSIPVPRLPHPLLGWALFLLGAVILYDAFDGRGKQGPWPASTLFPW